MVTPRERQTDHFDDSLKLSELYVAGGFVGGLVFLPGGAGGMRSEYPIKVKSAYEPKLPIRPELIPVSVALSD